ncbi:DUF1471 domain-containing protein [Pectobacterium odoriferum]|nr:DUF1471 domain-containing protein [Pectobacterium odoriferum]
MAGASSYRIVFAAERDQLHGTAALRTGRQGASELLCRILLSNFTVPTLRHTTP